MQAFMKVQLIEPEQDKSIPPAKMIAQHQQCPVLLDNYIWVILQALKIWVKDKVKVPMPEPVGK